jgi:hypothetical protein
MYECTKSPLKILKSMFYLEITAIRCSLPYSDWIGNRPSWVLGSGCWVKSRACNSLCEVMEIAPNSTIFNFEGAMGQIININQWCCWQVESEHWLFCFRSCRESPNGWLPTGVWLMFKPHLTATPLVYVSTVDILVTHDTCSHLLLCIISSMHECICHTVWLFVTCAKICHACFAMTAPDKETQIRGI